MGKGLIWVIVILVLVALVIWGLVSLGGDGDSGVGAGDDAAGLVVSGGDDTDTLIDNSLVGDEDDVD